MHRLLPILQIYKLLENYNVSCYHFWFKAYPGYEKSQLDMTNHPWDLISEAKYARKVKYSKPLFNITTLVEKSKWVFRKNPST